MTTDQKTNDVAGSTQEVMKVRYTPKTHTSGGRRDGVSRSDDGRLDVKFSAPGVPGTGTNPEQLFAAGWSACFIGAMGLVANKMKVKLPADVTIDAEIDLCNSGDVYFLRAQLNVSLPGLEREVAQAIVDATHRETCAYSTLHGATSTLRSAWCEPDLEQTVLQGLRRLSLADNSLQSRADALSPERGRRLNRASCSESWEPMIPIESERSSMSNHYSSHETK
jgi:osmotically inducible protein OsmC